MNTRLKIGESLEGFVATEMIKVAEGLDVQKDSRSCRRSLPKSGNGTADRGHGPKRFAGDQLGIGAMTLETIIPGMPSKYFPVGERLFKFDDPRSLVRIVRRVINETSCEVEVIRRASKGYRRYVRRRKSHAVN